MRKYLKTYTSFIEDAIKNGGNNFDWASLYQRHITKISFFQHERLIHLLVTFFFGFIFFLSVVLGLLLGSLGFCALGAILAVLLIFYIWHYFFLENGVQKLYRLSEEIEERLKV